MAGIPSAPSPVIWTEDSGRLRQQTNYDQAVIPTYVPPTIHKLNNKVVFRSGTGRPPSQLNIKLFLECLNFCCNNRQQLHPLPQSNYEPLKLQTNNIIN